MNFESINFTFNISFFTIIPLLIIGIGYTYFIYRFTVPVTSLFIKVILIILRSITLILIILLLFEFSVNLNHSVTVKPQSVLLIDNSSSIVNKDSVKRSEQVHTFISDFKNSISGNISYFTFGKNVTPIEITDNSKLMFNEPITNFDKIAKQFKREDNISSITLISDGILNEGTTSYSNFEKLNIPIFTIAIGDTIPPTDISIKQVSYNRLIYINKITEVKSIITNQNLAGRKVSVSLYDNSGIVAKEEIELNESGINSVTFNYEPLEIGKQRLDIKISQLSEEETHENNSYPFVLDILNDKIKVLLIAGAPSPDLSILTQSLIRNDNIKLSRIIQITPNQFIDTGNNSTKLDTADIIVMLDFPTNNTPSNLISEVKNSLSSNQKPFFFFISQLVDHKKLNIFIEHLPFGTSKILNNNIFVSPKAKSFNNPLLRNTQGWENLPPILINVSELELNYGTTILAVGSNRNIASDVPLIFSSNIASNRSIVFNGFKFWRWSLQRDNSVNNLFNNFIADGVKWLFASSDRKRLFINTSKDIYKSSESIDFTGNIYDESLSPRSDAIIDITITSGNFERSLRLISTKNGKYEGAITISQPGEFNYSATISIPGEKSKIVTGKFTISEINLENISFVLNSNYLNLISDITRGKSFEISDYVDIFSKINQLAERNTKDKIIETNYSIWKNEWVLAFLIILLSIEWLIRKKKGML